MNDVTRILSAIEQGDPLAAGRLLPLVYDELRKLAAQKLSHEKPGHTLQATALVHEAYLRLVAGGEGDRWESRAHFLAASAEAMRRILVDNARRKGAAKHGGGRGRLDAAEISIAAPAPDVDFEDLLDLDAALTRLAAEDAGKAQLVQLRYFAGLSLDDAARVMGISPATANRRWAFARAWLLRAMEGADPGPAS
jgi:RNA polymerase sigma factor (TIGR02999 family)